MAYRPQVNLTPLGRFTSYMVPTLPIVVNQAIKRSEVARNMATNSKMHWYEDYVADTFVCTLEAMVLGKKNTETTTENRTYTKKATLTADGDPVPTSWWQMLKRDHFPEWFKQRWPVKTTTPHYEQEQDVTFNVVEKVNTNIYRICPHNDIEFPDKRHLDFVLLDVEEK